MSRTPSHVIRATASEARPAHLEGVVVDDLRQRRLVCSRETVRHGEQPEAPGAKHPRRALGASQRAAGGPAVPIAAGAGGREHGGEKLAGGFDCEVTERVAFQRGANGRVHPVEVRKPGEARQAGKAAGNLCRRAKGQLDQRIEERPIINLQNRFEVLVASVSCSADRLAQVSV